MPERDFGFRWVTHTSETTAGYPSRHSHSDSTADAAIGNLMREERKKKKQPSGRYGKSKRKKDSSRRMPG